ncbi:hypothetical protein AS888_14630 [Peribacillus simplex]|uniref:Uncharacterized protein n=1 Tax=Peribacillus simplex TaxID=1478 RepID=A0A109MZT5_9BACI|nr:hypothetical protein [Peribacillus simplex]KWW20868.1 hypothetical protein AS888_14630 [Peribacillus simplex]
MKSNIYHSIWPFMNGVMGHPTDFSQSTDILLSNKDWVVIYGRFNYRFHDIESTTKKDYDFNVQYRFILFK